MIIFNTIAISDSFVVMLVIGLIGIVFVQLHTTGVYYFFRDK